MNLLESLKRHTTVVADTGDFETIAAYRPQDRRDRPAAASDQEISGPAAVVSSPGPTGEGL
jgi:hypothetical protein